MSHFIPRNELEAIVLMADATLTVRQSQGCVILLRHHDCNLLGSEHIAQIVHVHSPQSAINPSQNSQVS
jgi:hypothetical protein